MAVVSTPVLHLSLNPGELASGQPPKYSNWIELVWGWPEASSPGFSSRCNRCNTGVDNTVIAGDFSVSRTNHHKLEMRLKQNVPTIGTPMLERSSGARKSLLYTQPRTSSTCEVSSELLWKHRTSLAPYHSNRWRLAFATLLDIAWLK